MVESSMSNTRCNGILPCILFGLESGLDRILKRENVSAEKLALEAPSALFFIFGPEKRTNRTSSSSSKRSSYEGYPEQGSGCRSSENHFLSTKCIILRSDRSRDPGQAEIITVPPLRMDYRDDAKFSGQTA